MQIAVSQKNIIKKKKEKRKSGFCQVDESRLRKGVFNRPSPFLNLSLLARSQRKRKAGNPVKDDFRRCPS